MFTYAEKTNQNSRTDSSNSSWSGKTRINKKESEMNSIYLKNKIVIQPKLIINTPGDVYEREADAVADKVIRMSIPENVNPNHNEEQGIQRKESSNYDNPSTVPPIVNEVINSSSGKPLDEETRSFMEPRFGYDFSKVKIYDNDKAAESTNAINALAYTTGNKIVFNQNQFNPESKNGKYLLAHELTHVIQQSDTIRPYRPTPAMDKTEGKEKSFNFGEGDTDTLKESPFIFKKDKETKPWIELITITLQFQITDKNGFDAWVGDAEVKYFKNAVALPDFKFSITAGSEDLGMTTAGEYTVNRIEGVGYNSGKYSGTYERAAKKGWGRRYSKDLAGNMNYAVFFTKSEALHSGPLDQSSHGCVHVDWSDESNIRQINYHSVINHTKVKVSYT